VGFLYSDRTLTRGPDFNRVFAGDARLVFNGRYTFTTQIAQSWSEEEERTLSSKPSVFASLGRSGRGLAWSLSFHDMHPDFRAEVGYLPRIGEAVTIGNLTLSHYGPAGALLERVSLGLRGEGYFHHDDFWDGERPYEGEVQLLPSFSFRGDRTVSIILRNGYYRFPFESYSDYGVQAGDGTVRPFSVPYSLRNLKAVAVMPRLRINNSANLNGRMYFRELPIYAEAARGMEFLLAPQLTLKPTTSLALSLGQTYSRLWRRRDDSVFSTAIVSRISSQYQFSKALFARLMVQYNLEERAALEDPLSGSPITLEGVPVEARESGTVQGQFLLQYQPSPGTIFYVGYSRLMEGDYSFGWSRKDPVQDGLFVKLSYLFRV
jgi:hypothetical protein